MKNNNNIALKAEYNNPFNMVPIVEEDKKPIETPPTKMKQLDLFSMIPDSVYESIFGTLPRTYDDDDDTCNYDNDDDDDYTT